MNNTIASMAAAEAVAAAAIRATENTPRWGWNAACRHSQNQAVVYGQSKRAGRYLYCLARRLKAENEAAKLPAFLKRQAPTGVW